MLGLTLVTALALAQATPTSDTTVAVRRGTRLELSTLGGDIMVHTWDRNAVRVVAEHSSRERIEVKTLGAVVTVTARASRGAGRAVDYAMTVPRWMDMNLSGTYSDVSVDGAEGRVVAESVQGDLTVTGGQGLVSLQSVEGDVTLTNASGRIELNTTNGEIVARDLNGEVYAETVNGDIRLEAVRSGNVTATTVNGDLDYYGEIRNDGRYRLSTHNGDVTVAIPASANVTVSVATFQGEFESDFPLTLTPNAQGKRFSFTIGTGSGRLELESFQGTIRLRRP